MADLRMPDPVRGRARRRRCTFCPAQVEEDMQAAALHLIQACPRASDAAFAAAVRVLLVLRKDAEAKALATTLAAGADAAGQALAAQQVRLAWAERVGPVVAGLLDRAVAS